MRITHLTLKNWRTFKSLSVPVAERLIVIGPNASGKSNLLDAVRFLRDLAVPGGGLQDAVRSRGGMTKLRCLFSRNFNHSWITLSVVIEDGDDSWTYTVSFHGSDRSRLEVKEEVVLRGEREILRRPDDDDRADPERLTQTALEQISANRDFRPIAEFLSETRYLHLVPQVIRDAGRAGDVVDDPFGGDFIARMNSVTPRTRDAWLRRVTEALRVAVPQFSQLEVRVDDAGRPHLESRYTDWRESGARQDERDLSDGTLRLIGLLWSLVEVGRNGAPVLLEEPELSLHPAVVRMLPTVLARAQRSNGAQVLLTTHSPDILADEGVRPDEVLRLTLTPDGTSGTILSDDEKVAQQTRAGLTLVEAAFPGTAPPEIERLAAVDLGRR